MVRWGLSGAILRHPHALVLCPPYAIFFEGGAALVFGFLPGIALRLLCQATSRWQHRELIVPVTPLLFPAGLRSPEMAKSLKLEGYQEVMDTMVMPWTHDSNYKGYSGMDEEESSDDYLL
ncbi:unnamed protein product [Urochloa humidicola]